MYWTTGLTPKQIADTLVSNGKAYGFLAQAMEDTFTGQHLTAVTKSDMLSKLPSVTNSSQRNVEIRWELVDALKASAGVVLYEKKEVGSLILYPKNRTPTQGMALVDYLLQLPMRMDLNEAQTLELERLLNKVGTTLGIPMPTLPTVTPEQHKAALTELAVMEMLAKPTRFHQLYLDKMKAAGTPVTLTRKAFNQMIEDTFKPIP